MNIASSIRAVRVVRERDSFEVETGRYRDSLYTSDFGMLGPFG